MGSSISATGMMGLGHLGNRAKWEEPMIPRKALAMTQSHINLALAQRPGMDTVAQLVSPGFCS